MFIETAIEMVNLGIQPNGIAAADALLSGYRPSQIAEFLETYWQQGAVPNNMALGFPAGAAPAPATFARVGFIDGVLPPVPAAVAQDGWHHLVYAFMLENTRIYEIFRRVVQAYTHGERLPHATYPTMRWLRTTEELFLASPQSLTVRAVTSPVRPDDCAVRRNMYHRMLGMDLLGGAEDGRPYPYTKSDVANNDFVILFESLLSEVWKGYTNRNPALSETDTTDNNAIAMLAQRLQQMLMARRLYGNLSREEFQAVAAMSWFRLAITVNSQIVQNLSAQAVAEVDRLRQIGNLVGLPCHSRSDAFFRLAAPMSFMLREIENGNVAAVGPAGLYAAGPYQAPMLEIISNWSIATGRDLKDPARRQATLPVLTDTARLPNFASGNGHQPVSRIPAALMR